MKKSILITCIVLLSGWAQAQVPNANFELWVNDSTPSNWTTMYNAGIVTEYFGHKTTGISGSALQINSKLVNLGITQVNVPGFATLGKISINLANNTGTTDGGIPFIAKPDSMKGYYKYVPDPTSDMMIASILLTRWNTATLKRDTIGLGSFSNSNLYTVFMEFGIKINYVSSLDPDSMNISFTSSNPAAAKANGVLVIDQITLTGGNIGIHEIPLALIRSLQPNPSTGRFVLYLNNLTSGRLSIFDSRGKMVYEDADYHSGSEINLGTEKSGLYFVQVQNGTRVYSKKLVIQ